MADINQGMENARQSASDYSLGRRARIEGASAGESAERQHESKPMNITDKERIASAAFGGLLALYGLSRRSWAGKALAGMGAALAYRGATGRSYLYKRLKVDSRSGAIELNEKLTIERPPEEVYAFWRKLENLPKFMRHIESVVQTSPTRSHWVAQATGKGPALEWDSEIIEDKPNELIRWQAVGDVGIQHNGEVRFSSAPDAYGTELEVHIQYRAPVGAAAAFVYPFTKWTLKKEIRRLKQVLDESSEPIGSTTSATMASRAASTPAKPRANGDVVEF